MAERVRLYEGDCLEVLPTLADGSVDAVIADPPYGTTRSPWDSVIPLAPLWSALSRLLKPGAPVVLFSSQPFTTELVASNRENFRYELIWDKKNPSGHLNAKRQPLRRHENVCVFCDREPLYQPQMRRGRFRQRGSATLASDCYGEQSGSITFGDEYYPTSILEFSNAHKAGKLHPNEKPVDLLGWLLRTYTAPGDVVLDFCAGSGTLALAARIEGRHAVLVERDAEYAELIRRRLADAEGPLFSQGKES